MPTPEPVASAFQTFSSSARNLRRGLSLMGTDSQKASEAATLPAAAIAALEQGNKIAAIKALRVGRNMGLKEAKAMVDGYVRTRPELQRSLAAARNRTIATKLVLAIVIVAALLLVLRFLSRS